MTDFNEQIPTKDAFLQKQQENNKLVARGEISINVADTPSLLGTTSDSIHLVLFELAKLCESLNKATTLAEVRSSAKPLTDLLSGFAAKVTRNEVQLPYQAKGIEQVISDIETRATSVAQILATKS
ncbi:hypothetical protein [Pseudoalteromonas denitrificans]|uniref:Uncharacterized protein n=1 Tax=Pseudoalteromonas denitrificans DSM 6059 TaxID=1123010 RepID=A0A1I1PW69_9GAMM|nr:hypothetical protein [Pseudoalteromonas denitrificans]SFD14099.1 hypothetical protein SAMN02745724_03627 [Pseudoalteromonas denitrificans DSM 6059]